MLRLRQNGAYNKDQEIKMATFFNQATLSFGGTLTNSNVVSGEITDALSATKTAVSVSYGSSDGVAYVISIVNAGASDSTDITVTDDLGAFTYGALTLTPLTYIDGTLSYYVNGVLQPAPTTVAGPPLVISDITVPAGGNALIIYEARVNSFADMTAGSVITNTASVTGTCINSVISTTVTVGEETELSISKAICPDQITCQGELSYTFVIQNTGNTEAVATDDVIITDVFNPIFSEISVTYNGSAWTEGVNYTYDATTGAFATLPGQITVPAASYTRDPATGAVTLTPGTAEIKVTGTV